MNLWEEQTERQPIRVAKVSLGQQICKTNTQFRTFCRRNGKKVLRWHRRRLPIGGNIVLGILFWHLVWGSTPIRFMFMMSPHFPPGARKLFLAVVYSGLSLTLVCVFVPNETSLGPENSAIRVYYVFNESLMKKNRFVLSFVLGRRCLLE